MTVPAFKFEKLATKIKSLSTNQITEIVMGTIGDIESKKFGPHEQVTPSLTIADFERIPNWKNDPTIIAQMVQMAIGRCMRFIALNSNIQPENMDVQQLVRLNMMTDELEQKSIKAIQAKIAH